MLSPGGLQRPRLLPPRTDLRKSLEEPRLACLERSQLLAHDSLTGVTLYWYTVQHMRVWCQASSWLAGGKLLPVYTKPQLQAAGNAVSASLLCGGLDQYHLG